MGMSLWTRYWTDNGLVEQTADLSSDQRKDFNYLMVKREKEKARNDSGNRQ